MSVLRSVDHLDRLKEINAVYLAHLKAFAARSKKSGDMSFELQALKGRRSSAATAHRVRLKESQAQITFDLDKTEAAMLHAAEMFDALTPKEQDQVRARSFAVIKDLESHRRHRTMLRERFGL